MKTRAAIGSRWLIRAALCAAVSIAHGAERPNILWLTSEDHGPHMGCYGDAYATTPQVDSLASRGVIYTRVWSCAPVCAPARTTLISGLYPPSTGSEHMRSMVQFPEGKKMFPEILRDAGYYCVNNAKEDYNLAKSEGVWDESSGRAHWRRGPKGKPFFAVFNSTRSHESQVRRRPHRAVHEPGAVRVPPYHPDTPEVRQDWAQYYDVVSQADADARARLKELETDGLADRTIVFYFADHGSGLPRNKRMACDSGLHVPLVVHIPDAFRELRPAGYQAGGRIDRLVSFVDFAPTMLSLASLVPPTWMQGRAFLGPHAAPAPEFLFGFRGRMDERSDLVRGVTDGRFVYVRNFFPHRPHGQWLAYMFQTPTTQVWYRLHQEGKLTTAQDAFWRTKQPEELYDLTTDRDEVNNLAAEPKRQATLERFRVALRRWEHDVRDLGFLAEGDMIERSRGKSPYDALASDTAYPFARVYAAADAASSPATGAIETIKKNCRDSDAAVRRWGVLGLLFRGAEGYRAGHKELLDALNDSSPYARIVAAEAIERHGESGERDQARRVMVAATEGSRNNVWTIMAALDAVGSLPPLDPAFKGMLKANRSMVRAPHPRYAEYVPRLWSMIDSK